MEVQVLSPALVILAWRGQYSVVTNRVIDQFRIVATDLDGTLLRADGSVSEFTRDVICRVKQAGVHVVPVTARPPRTTIPLAEVLGVRGYAICGSGSLLFDLSNEEIVAETPLDPGVCERIVTALRGELPGVAFAAERRLRFARESHYVPSIPTTEFDELDALAFPQETVTKLLAKHDAFQLETLLEAVERAAGGEAIAETSGGNWIEIRAHGGSKAAMLEKLCADLGVQSHEVIAFGDLPIDLSMLEWAGRSVAPANAHPDVLARVDAVCGSNDTDGVAAELERLLSIGAIGATRS